MAPSVYEVIITHFSSTPAAAFINVGISMTFFTPMASTIQNAVIAAST